MNIIYNSPLSATRVSLLNQCASIRFELGEFSSLDDILTSLNVDVIIEPGIIRRSIPNSLKEAEEYWRYETNRLDAESRDAEDKEAAWKDIENAKKNVENIHNEIDEWLSMPLRGLYDPQENVIKLYPYEMMQECNGNYLNELLVSTLAHETMHAYFNRTRQKKNLPYIILVEEPLAEFGMLLYFHETGNSTFCDWAYNDVSSKKTCYHYGAMLMNQYLKGEHLWRQYLEKYKIKLIGYPMPTLDPTGGIISMPIKGSAQQSPVIVGGKSILPKWKDVFTYPPRYFYDKATNTFGLDGDWSEDPMYYQKPRNEDFHATFQFIEHGNNSFKNVYLGDNFTIGDYIVLKDLLSSHDVEVSPSNKKYYAIQGIPFSKKNKKPILHSCGKGFYDICRNGKWGVIDGNLNLVVPCIYEDVGSFDKNGLLKVENCDHYGLINKQGQEQVAVQYDKIYDNHDGTYTVRQNGQEFNIDKYGNKI